MYRADPGSNFGWPYCFYDYGLKKLLLNPEYGGDGKTVGRCSQFTNPDRELPRPLGARRHHVLYRHPVPRALQRRSVHRLPRLLEPRAHAAGGGNVTFQPFANGKPSGKFEIFASGFAGKAALINPDEAVARADGVAQAPDGSLYITESQKGKIWRVFYRGTK